MRDEELALRFFAFWIHGLDSYRTPQKHWLSMAAKEGKKYSDEKISELKAVWIRAIDTSLEWFDPSECFRRLGPGRSKAINRALFDLVMLSAARVEPAEARQSRSKIRAEYRTLLNHNEEFNDLISRAVDHTKRTKRRFQLWDASVGDILR
jgi:hypothetical protein